MAGIQSCGAAAYKRQRRKSGRRQRRWSARDWPRPRAAGDNAGMEIILNGERRKVDDALTVLQLLQGEGLAERRVAVEVNGAIVPRSRHGKQPLAAGDRIEIVHALGGG